MQKLVVLVGICAIFIITWPLELFLIPALIVSLFMPSKRKTYRFCRNCKWNENASKPMPAA